MTKFFSLTSPMWRGSYRRLSTLRVTKKGNKSSAEEEKNIRNIGILAHIDAGKTTTTERMLFCAGATRCIGDVDDGDTVTDYMDQERQRGITITSACVTFSWNLRQINLIDTPGHVDFTIEVERVMRALDGAVTILDASAGVEAQTLTVWDQARRYALPSIAFLNKMDKEAANVPNCMRSIEKKLGIRPILTQVPCGSGKNFHGIVDLVTMKKHTWIPGESRSNIDCTSFEKPDWKVDAKLYEESLRAREIMLSALGDSDDAFATRLIEAEQLDSVPESEISEVLRRVTLSRTGLCVYLGAAFRNVGVQPLLEGVVDCLPNPTDVIPDFVKHFKKQLCAVAFKILYDPLLGYLTFLRVFSGELKASDKVLVPRLERHEKVGRVYKCFGDQLVEVDSVAAGDIAVVAGLKEASTGDLLCHSLPKSLHLDGDEEGAIGAMLRIPDPVFFSSVEAGSALQQKELDRALERLCREDPSIAVRIDGDTGQTVIGGMGELHLDITKERLRRDYGVEAYMGPLEVAYKESIASEATDTLEFSRVIGDRKHTCTLTMTVNPMSDDSGAGKKKLLSPWRSGDNDENINAVKPYQWKALEQGVAGALRTGPLMSFPVFGVRFYLKWFQCGPGTSPLMISAAASQLAHQVLKSAQGVVMEPVMNLELLVDDEHSSSVVSDLHARRGVVSGMEVRQNMKVIMAKVPLSELVGYSTAFRKMTSGLGTFSMQLAMYEAMDGHLQEKLAEKILGYVPH